MYVFPEVDVGSKLLNLTLCMLALSVTVAVTVTVWLWELVVKATLVSSALKELIVGFTLSIYLLVIVTLSNDTFPALSVTSNATAALCDPNEESLE